MKVTAESGLPDEWLLSVGRGGSWVLWAVRGMVHRALCYGSRDTIMKLWLAVSRG